jgi:thioredoxin reductase (NADPH)
MDHPRRAARDPWLAVLLLRLSTVTGAAAQYTGPLFDAHLHYNDEAYLIERIRKNDAITPHFHTEVTALHGEQTLTGVTLREADKKSRMEAAGLFIMVGAAPNTGWLSDLVDLDSKGFVMTGDGYVTSCPGIFAVGDVRAGSVKRVASAVGEGSVVISKVWSHVAGSTND